MKPETKPELRAVLQKDYASFLRRSFRTINGDKLGKEPYLDYLGYEIELFAKGKTRRLVINMPPRHLKTFAGSICLSAWTLAHKPSTQIMIITNTDKLCTDIAYDIRTILQAEWFKDTFPTRIAEDRSRVTDFATKDGGGVYAVSIGGAITGRGADLIIVDDPLHIGQASDVELLEKVNTFFDTVILSRLNNPKKGRVAIIAHRLHRNDLSGHVLTTGDWYHVVLPMIATKTIEYSTGHDTWRRRKGELLRPDASDRTQIEQLRAHAQNPDFETLYQQDPNSGLLGQIEEDHFLSFPISAAASLPIALSIDPGQRGGPTNSFSVIQAWCCAEDNYLLVDQWREQCDYKELRSICRAFIREYRPSAVLIEATGQGPALLSDLPRKSWMRVEPILPGARSKARRLRDHLEVIRGGRIWLRADGPWREEFVAEFIEFPAGEFDDQIDATTQYLDFIRSNPRLEIPPQRAIAAIATYRR
jgi:predicted phage terminase large subunit-like protein